MLYCLISLLFIWYSIIMLLYFSQIINNFLSLFWRYTSYLGISLLCASVTVSEFLFFFATLFRFLWFHQQFYYQSNHQLPLLFLNWSLWYSLKSLCSAFFGMIKVFLAVITTQAFTNINTFLSIFYPYFEQKTNIRSLLHILLVKLSSTSFFIFYILINN